MRRMRSGFQIALVTVGMLWLGAWLLLPAKSESAPVPGSQRVITALPAPLVMISTSDDLLVGDALRREIRAVRIGPNGGVLQCGPALLVVPPDAVTTETRFYLEDFSDHMPRVEFAQSATALLRAPQLHISYLDTPYEESGFDLSALKIYRQTSREKYEAMPSRVDLDQGCVIAEITESGVYIIA